MSEIKKKSLFKSLINIFKYKSDEAARAIADPVVDGYVAIRDSKEQLAKFKQQVVDVRANQQGLIREKLETDNKYEELKSAAKNIKGKLETAQKELDYLKTSADTPVSSVEIAENKVSELEKALQTAATNAVSLQKKAESLKNTIDAQKQTLDDLDQTILDLENKIDTSENNYDQMKARNTAADIQLSIEQAKDDLLGKDSPFSQLDILTDSVEEKEDRVKAQREMNSISGSASVDNIIEKYANGKSAEVDDFVKNL